MTDPFWNDLLFKIDDEIMKLESGGGPDMTEYELLKEIDNSPRDLDLQWQLVEHLIEKTRQEDAIPVILNILAVDRNHGDKKAYTTLMEIFSKLGSNNDQVKSGRKKLANIMF